MIVAANDRASFDGEYAKIIFSVSSKTSTSILPLNRKYRIETVSEVDYIVIISFE